MMFNVIKHHVSTNKSLAIDACQQMKGRIGEADFVQFIEITALRIEEKYRPLEKKCERFRSEISLDIASDIEYSNLALMEEGNEFGIKHSKELAYRFNHFRYEHSRKYDPDVLALDMLKRVQDGSARIGDQQQVQEMFGYQDARLRDQKSYRLFTVEFNEKLSLTFYYKNLYNNLVFYR
jgi:hypothetical protein